MVDSPSFGRQVPDVLTMVGVIAVLALGYGVWRVACVYADALNNVGDDDEFECYLDIAASASREPAQPGTHSRYSIQ